MSESYKIIFAGTPIFSVNALEALLKSNHEVKAVYTQPDRPSGRGQQLAYSPVKTCALKHHLAIYQPHSLKNETEQQILKNIDADLMIVVAYGLILPKAILNAPKWGCINIHASLLPRWRGAAPIQRAILAGDAVTGITMMKMDVGLDRGDILYQKHCAIEPYDTSASLHEKLSLIGAESLIYTLENLPTLKPHPQGYSDVIYAEKLTKEEAIIDWKESAVQIDRKIRAFNPWPIAYTFNQKNRLRIWQASVVNTQKTFSNVGEIILSEKELTVTTGKGLLRLEKIQLPGGNIISASDLLNSRKQDFAAGVLLG